MGHAQGFDVRGRRACRVMHVVLVGRGPHRSYTYGVEQTADGMNCGSGVTHQVCWTSSSIRIPKSENSQKVTGLFRHSV